MPQLWHADELADLVGAQVIEPGEGEGEFLLLDLLDHILELDCQSPFSQPRYNSLFTLELMMEHAVKVTTERRSAFSKQLRSSH